MRHVIIAIIIFILVGTAVFWFFSKHMIRIETDKQTYELFIEIADDSDERSTGLMNRDSFGKYEAMLFVYEKEGYPSFWMKNMKFPLDIIFIGGDLKIRQIEENIHPCTSDAINCPLITPSYSVRYILEVPAGYVKKHQIKVGQIVEL